MPLGDSITAGYTDNPHWAHPFAFGYRLELVERLQKAGIPFTMVGTSPEPFDGTSGTPVLEENLAPGRDLRQIHQNGHRGYGGVHIGDLIPKVGGWIAEDRPDLILLMIGVNGIGPDSPSRLEALVENIFTADEDVGLIVAQIPPKVDFDANLTAYNTFIRESLVPTQAAAGRDIDIVDLHRLFLRDPDDPQSIDPEAFSNGINHPTNEHYNRMAEAWFAVLVRGETQNRREDYARPLCPM
jgi:lysophospholipase L1-like esterase